VWVKAEFGHLEPAAYWRQRLEAGMAHNLGLAIAKAVQGQLAAGVAPLEVLRQAALFGARNLDGWGTGMTILTALGNLLAILPEEEIFLALFHGHCHVREFYLSTARRARTPHGGKSMI
jgi:hypothetical protein